MSVIVFRDLIQYKYAVLPVYDSHYTEKKVKQ